MELGVGAVAYLDSYYRRVGLVWYYCHPRQLTKEQGRDGHDSLSPPYFYKKQR